MERFQRLEFGAFFRFFIQQPPSFWLVSMYLLFEYVRPQSIYPGMDVLPWAQWTILACTAAALAEGKLFRGFDRADGWLLLFSAILVVSCFTAYEPAAAFQGLEVYAIWVLVYLLITRSVDNEARYFFFYCLFLLFSLKMSQHASRSWVGVGMQFRDWGATGAPGWFGNSGEMAIQMTIFLPMSIYFGRALKPHLAGLTRKWKYWATMALPATAVLALLASSSRGGQLGGVAVGLWMLLRSKQRARSLVLAGICGLMVFAMLPEAQRDRFREMGSDDTSTGRVRLWKNGIEITNDHPVLGVGYNNWYTYYLREGYHEGGGGSPLSHNIFVQAGAELGYTGFAAFLILIGTTFRMNRATRRRARRLPEGRTLQNLAYGLDGALIGFMVSGFFVTVLYYPYFWINYAMTAALYKVVAKRGGGVGKAAHAAATRRGPGSQPRAIPGARPA